MAWAKGQSGNPGGRSKTTGQIRELAKAHAPEALTRVVELMKSADERVAFVAAQEILNRVYGKPAQAVTGPDGEGPVKLVVMWQQSDAS